MGKLKAKQLLTLIVVVAAASVTIAQGKHADAVAAAGFVWRARGSLGPASSQPVQTQP
jgi:hypothetical protein